MSIYKIIPIDGAGCVIQASACVAATDREAIGIARHFRHRYDNVELWHRGKCITRLARDMA
jgi:hypothetical protein